MLLLLPFFFVLGLLYLLSSRQLLSSLPKRERLRKPVASLTEDECKYNVKSLEVPRTTGVLFKLMIKILYTRFGKNVVMPFIMKKSGLMLFDGMSLPETPTFVPLISGEQPSIEKDVTNNEEEIDKLMKLDAKRSSGHPKPVTVADYIQGYQSHKFTPLEVSNTIA